MNDKHWIAALSGLGFLVVIIIAVITLGAPPSLGDDTVREIIDYYSGNDAELWAGLIVEILAAALLVFYGGYLRMVLREAEGEGHMLSPVVLAGATITAIGFSIDATINLALLQSINDLDPPAVQAISALWNNDYLVVVLGMFVFMLSAGMSSLRHGALPKWLAWVAIVTAFVIITPAGFFGMFAAALWIATTSVMFTMRERASGRPEVSGTPGIT